MTLNDALLILMQAAVNDVRGSGLGMRSTTDAWRKKVSSAWAVAFKRIYKYSPSANDFINAGMIKQ